MFEKIEKDRKDTIETIETNETNETNETIGQNVPDSLSQKTTAKNVLAEEAKSESEKKDKTKRVLKEKAEIMKERAKEASENPYELEQKEREKILMGAKKGKIIALWGDNGITSLATVLAGELAEKKHKEVLIIDMNRILPANAIWHIQQPVEQEKSVGLLLRNTEINSSNIAKYFVIEEKTQPNIATLAYTDGTNIVMNNEKASYSLYVQLLKSAQSIVDYVIVACTKEISDMMSLAAFQFASYQIFSLTPDARGIEFYKCNVPLLANEQFNKCPRYYVTNMATNNNDSVAFGTLIKQDVIARIPMDDGIRKSIALGEYLKANRYVGFGYRREVHKIMKRFNENYEEVDPNSKEAKKSKKSKKEKKDKKK